MPLLGGFSIGLLLSSRQYWATNAARMWGTGGTLSSSRYYITAHLTIAAGYPKVLMGRTTVDFREFWKSLTAFSLLGQWKSGPIECLLQAEVTLWCLLLVPTTQLANTVRSLLPWLGLCVCGMALLSREVRTLPLQVGFPTWRDIRDVWEPCVYQEGCYLS